jgi:catechol 2,3-dioxygenase-like lactoylglutathione lyase family enzyme
MTAPRPRVTGVLETVLYYTDVEATERFYSDVLGFRLLSKEAGRSLFYRAGTSVFLLFDARETLRGDHLPAHGSTGPVHTCFVAPPSDYEGWKAYLGEQGVPILQEVQWKVGVLSFYFPDPAGNVLEIANGDLWPK